MGLPRQGEVNRRSPQTHCFFFYGTLLDADLRRALCGAEAEAWRLTAAELAGYRRGRSPSRTYPYLVPDPQGRVCGMVADGLTSEAAAVLTLYEGRGYRIAAVVPELRGDRLTCWAFVPRRPVLAPLPWTLEGWAEKHKAAALKRLRAWRSDVGEDEIAAAAVPWRERPRWPPG